MYMRAFALAMGAHEGQVYGKDRPYIHHCLEVVHMLQTTFDNVTLNERCVAILHDVVEDTDVTLEDLRAHGFSEEIVQGVGLLTKDENLDYSQNIQRIVDSGNLSAMRVKFSDNRANHENCGPDRERQRRKYDNSMLRLARAIAKEESKTVRYESEKKLRNLIQTVDSSTRVV